MRDQCQVDTSDAQQNNAEVQNEIETPHEQDDATSDIEMDMDTESQKEVDLASEQGQELEMTSDETPETVQDRINQRLQDLYVRGGRRSELRNEANQSHDRKDGPTRSRKLRRGN
ncbi:hypothetical protein CFIMG_008004RA00001 [Ceratocystis fimbriata CBS 114723]|uniref:Uncharacterized protein n=1 Tax=Ceratocystis fimbriata CBS 114723 TaxID=1035309 RepID=A0A2C5WTD7_9PEZI|nr:hypothetical protein CFIMG_008004RA00001 [Ceratocystis fimbriata CBS 114723]